MNVYLAKQVMKRFGKHFGEKYTNDQAWKRRFDTGDDSAIDELIDRACLDFKVAPNDFADIVERIPELRTLQKQLLQEIILGRLGTHGVESKRSTN